MPIKSPNYFSFRSLRGVAEVVVLLSACLTLRTVTEARDGSMANTVHVPPSERPVPTAVAGNKTANDSDYSEKPIISSVSNDTTLNIHNDHAKVYLICEATGENISGGYWARVNGNRLSANHNKSMISYHDDGKTIRVGLTIVAAHPGHSGGYHCIVYGQWGMLKSKKVKVVIKIAPPEIIHQPSNRSIVALHNATFTCKASGYRVQYQWRNHSDHAIIGTGSTLTFIRATPLDTGQYYCVAVTKGGYAFSSNVTLKINDGIDLVIQPSKLVVAEGETINIHVIAEGPGKENFTYQWRRDNASLASTAFGKNTPSLTITSATLSDGGPYYCVVKNQWGHMIESNRSIMSVISLPTIIVHPSSTTVAEGSNVVLMCEATGEGTLNYQWEKVSGSLPEGSLGYNDTNLTIFNVTINDRGHYYCKVDNGGTSVDSMKSNVIVKRKPIITSVSRSQVYTVTDDDKTVELVCKITGDDITLAYWERLNGALPNVTNRNAQPDSNQVILKMSVKAHPRNSGDFQCIAYSQWGVTSSTIASVSIMAAPPTFIEHPTDVAAIALENVTFKAEAKGFRIKFEWMFYNSSGTYLLSTQKTNKSRSTLTLYRVTPSNAGHYYCVAKTHGKNQVLSHKVTLTVNDSFTVIQNPEYIAGINGSVVLNVVSKGPGSVYYKYQWEKVGSDSLPSTASGQDTPSLIIREVKMADNGSYICHVRNTWGKTVPSNVASMLVLSVELQPLNMSVPALGFVNYTCQSSITSSVKYQWIHNETLMNNESSAILNITNLHWNETGIYRCMVIAMNNVSVESNSGFLNMTSKSVQPSANVNSITAGKIALICVFSVLAVVIFLVLVGSVYYFYYKRITNKLSLSHVESPASVVEMSNQRPTERTATEATATTTMNSTSTSNTNGNDSGNNNENGDNNNDNGDNNDNGSIDNDNGSNDNDSGDNNDNDNIDNDNRGNDNDISYNNTDDIIDNDNGNNDSEINNENCNPDDNGSDSNNSNDNCNDNDESINNYINTSSSSNNSSASIKKQTGRIQISNDGTKNLLDIITEMNPDLQKLVNITELLPYLNKHGIPTTSERENLESKYKTNSEKVQDLLSQLHQKGEIGHKNFIRAIYESSKNQGNSGHREIIERFKSKGISITESEE